MSVSTSSPVLSVCVESRIRVFPESPPADISVTPLSIVDACVVRWPPAAAVWYFDTTTDERTRASLLPRHLLSSLQRTLNFYPQWAGQLQWATHEPHGDHTQRVGRLCVSYGAPTDPGVEFVVASSPKFLTHLLPSPSERSAGDKWWDAAQVPSAELLPSTKLALHNLIDYEGLPGMMVQVTTFACGMMAVGVKAVHALIDAHSLVQFVQGWAGISRAMLAGAPLPVLSPLFDPRVLDRAAAGDIDAAQPDPMLVEKARSLPMHRHDWWAPTNGGPPRVIPPALQAATKAPVGTPMPWSEWKPSLPVAHHSIHFTKSEVQGMWERARSSSPPHLASAISYQDAIAAHIWTLVNRARGVEPDEVMHMNVTLDIRGRLSPPLPGTFIGSPLFLCRASATGREATSESSSAGTLAARIRSTIKAFDAPALAALLHDKAHDIGVVRVWHGFLGRRNMIISSWVHYHLYQIDFGTGTRPRYVETVMPSVDGCMQIVEAAPILPEEADIDVEGMNGPKPKHWSDGGVDVVLRLGAEAMQRLVKDPLLREYSV